MSLYAFELAMVAADSERREVQRAERYTDHGHIRDQIAALEAENARLRSCLREVIAVVIRLKGTESKRPIQMEVRGRLVSGNNTKHG